MTDPVHVPPPVFNFSAYSPAEIQEAVETVGVKKTNMPFLPSFTLAVVAGGAIGLGALYYTIVVSDPTRAATRAADNRTRTFDDAA
jgi:formate transporter